MNKEDEGKEIEMLLKTNRFNKSRKQTKFEEEYFFFWIFYRKRKRKTEL